jgi:hypothetical protein
VLVENLAPIYEGQDATATRALFDRVWRSINFLGHERPGIGLELSRTAVARYRA